jgi:hypothetical protein
MINKFSESSDTKKNLLSILLIAALAVIIYSNSFYNSFHFDDTPSIVENYAIHRFDIQEIFSTSSRPILGLTFALNYYFGKLNVFGYHLVNLMLHVANGVMLYFILLWTVNPINRVNSVNSVNPTNIRLPLYASLIFVVHPIQTQAVTYIVNRSSVLATTFYLLALLLFIKGFQSNPTNSRSSINSRNLYFVGAFLASCLGMGTKQIAVTLPVMLIIYDFYFISNGDWKIVKSHYKIHLIMFSTIAIAVYLSFSGLKMFVSFDYAKGVPMMQQEPITSFQYFLTQLHVIPYYIRLLFIPANLNLDYDWPVTRNIDLPTTLFFILIITIIAVAIKLFRKARLISFGIIWFFVTLSVTSSFIVLFDVIFEHRLYLPSIGFSIVIAFLISKISGIRQRSLVTGQQSMTNK